VTIETHSDLKGNTPELIRLAVRAQQDAAANRARNDRLRATTLAGAGHGHQPAPTAAPPTPGVTPPSATPPPGTPPPVVTPTHAPPARGPRSRNPKA
jgi:hypothetical protein